MIDFALMILFNIKLNITIRLDNRDEKMKKLKKNKRTTWRGKEFAICELHTVVI